eukprot:7109085-Prymnesium_polylepis.3
MMARLVCNLNDVHGRPAPARTRVSPLRPAERCNLRLRLANPLLEHGDHRVVVVVALLVGRDVVGTGRR